MAIVLHFRGASWWLVLKCVQNLDGESSLPTTVLKSGRMSRQCLQVGGGDGLDWGGQ